MPAWRHPDLLPALQRTHAALEQLDLSRVFDGLISDAKTEGALIELEALRSVHYTIDRARDDVARCGRIIGALIDASGVLEE